MRCLQGDHLRALDIWLHIEDPCVFEFIDQQRLYDAAARGAAQLMAVDDERATAMLVEHHSILDANEVAEQLRGRVVCAADSSDRQLWRKRLYRYLHALFVKDRRASHSFHDLQVRPAPAAAKSIQHTQLALHLRCVCDPTKAVATLLCL
jgi:hypothetical protein